MSKKPSSQDLRNKANELRKEANKIEQQASKSSSDDDFIFGIMGFLFIAFILYAIFS